VKLTVAPAIALKATMFDASQTVDPDGDDLQFWWTFGDGTPARTTYAISTTRHTYEKAGTYTVNVTGKSSITVSDIV